MTRIFNNVNEIVKQIYFLFLKKISNALIKNI